MHFVLVAATLKIYVIFFSTVLVSFAGRHTLLNKMTNIGSTILDEADATATKILLIGNWEYSDEINLQISNASIEFIVRSKRFEEPLLNSQ